LYFYAEFSRPFASYQTWQSRTLQQGSSVAGDGIGFVSTQSTTAGEQIEVRVGISYISADQARRNLQLDSAGRGFEAIEAALRSQWNTLLDKVKTSGGTDRQRTIFYTALWRSLGRMTDISEYDRYFSGYDHAVHDTDGHDFYVDDGLWDTFRSMHPLQLLLDGHRQEDMVRSYLRMYQQSGWLPSFPSVAGEQAVMIGHHADQLILDTYSKGFRSFDLQLAYEAMRKNATEATLLPWKRVRSFCWARGWQVRWEQRAAVSRAAGKRHASE
jgi:predicted alpha-1,2-mannosidase